MSPALFKEKEAAIQAVSRASILARLVQEECCQEGFLTKADRSPVTLADFAIQALIAKCLSSSLPAIALVAEEEASSLREERNAHLLDRIFHLLNRFYPPFSRNEILDLIDNGKGNPGSRFWTLDPIDGTQGFLRGDQFAVALALIEDGIVKLGVLGCPRLLRVGDESSISGFLFWAKREDGSALINLSSAIGHSIHVSARSVFPDLRIVESYESSHSDFITRAQVQAILGIEGPVRQMDGQVKYGIVACGDAEVYMRIPHPDHASYREKIWDHAAGALILEEAGGRVTDINGRLLDYSQGRQLEANRGVLATNDRMHERLVETIANSSAGKSRVEKNRD